MTFHFVLKFVLKSHFGPYEHLYHLKNHPGDQQMSFTGWWQSDLLPPGQAQLAQPTRPACSTSFARYDTFYINLKLLNFEVSTLECFILIGWKPFALIFFTKYTTKVVTGMFWPHYSSISHRQIIYVVSNSKWTKTHKDIDQANEYNKQ